jgi:hypothetical protein
MKKESNSMNITVNILTPILYSITLLVCHLFDRFTKCFKITKIGLKFILRTFPRKETNRAFSDANQTARALRKRSVATNCLAGRLFKNSKTKLLLYVTLWITQLCI